MPILSSIQKRSAGGRLLIAAMYLIAVVGAAWMIYPLLLMLSGSVKSDLDIREFDAMPRYLYDDAMLFRKFEEQRYGTLDNFTIATRYRDSEGRALYGFEFLEARKPLPASVLRDWEEFAGGMRSWPRHFTWPGHCIAFRMVSELGMKYQRHLWDNHPSIPRNEVGFWLPHEAWMLRSYQMFQGEYADIYSEFRKMLPARYFIPNSVEGFFIATYLPGVYGSDADAVRRLNAKWGSHYATLFDVILSPTPPTQAGQRENWWDFVRNNLSSRFIKLDRMLLPAYQNYLRARYQDLGEFNKAYHLGVAAWDKVGFPAADAPMIAFSDYQSFIETLSSSDGVYLDAADFRWRTFLRQKYGDDIAALNRVHQTAHASFDQITMPLLAYDQSLVMQNKRAIVWELVARNYRAVWRWLSVQGRAFQNTLLFCALNILTALIVNPIAAYALSRFQPRWGYKAMFFLMATMAFPGEVTQIPAFLMLREMGMLNTFAALIIPAAANGYSIFLLKGFFDSLPKDLYEAATLDGASELRIFGTITMPLSAPILAVIALGAFTAAYGSFMFALLVCQDPSMWTLMVYIYQLQQLFNTPVIFAALVLAAIPTLLVFVFCQNIIMRGIVVPVEK